MNEKQQNWLTTYLSDAIEKCKVVDVEILISLGADVNKKNHLRTAVRSGSVEIVKILLENGADVNFKEDYKSPIDGDTALSLAESYVNQTCGSVQKSYIEMVDIIKSYDEKSKQDDLITLS